MREAAARERAAVEGLSTGPMPAVEELPLLALLVGADDDGEGGEPVEVRDLANRGGRAMGRPPGSRNRSTTAWANYVSSLGNPLTRMAQLMNADTLRLAALLGAEPIEVVKVQLGAAKELANYTNSRMPTNLKIDSRGAMVIAVPPADAVPGPASLHESLGDALDALDAMRIEGRGEDPRADAEIVEFQEVNGTGPAAPNGPHPNDGSDSDANSKA